MTFFNNKLLPLSTTMMAIAGCCSIVLVIYHHHHKKKIRKSDSDDNVNHHYLLTAHEQLILKGTPLIELKKVSELLGRHIYVKMESMNPGGTGKDRAALSMIQDAEEHGLLPLPKPDSTATTINDLLLYEEQEGCQAAAADNTNGNANNNSLQLRQEKESCKMIVESMRVSRTGGLVVEGTSGSTGIALATLCAARGHACLVVLPDDQAKEKQDILRAIGAVVYEVPTAAISNPNHYVNIARRMAKLAREKFNILAVFMDQFENEANFDIHYERTGPELYGQLNGKIDAFCMSSGTGGTIAGVGTYLKEQNEDIQIVLIDPPGSALFHKIEHGVAYAPQQQERTIRKHRYDTIAEGIGLDRVTHNFSLGLDSIDNAIRVTDQEALDMAHWILRVEGLWIGSSSSMNLVGAIRTARDLPFGSTVVTMICDGGQRHATRFWNPTFVQDWGLDWPSERKRKVPDCLEGLKDNIFIH